MSNSPTRRVRHTPKVSEYDAYDQLGPKVRRALQEALISWDPYHCLRMVKKYGADRVIAAIRNSDEKEAKKGFIKAQGKRKAQPSTLVACKVSILRANW